MIAAPAGNNIETDGNQHQHDAKGDELVELAFQYERQATEEGAESIIAEDNLAVTHTFAIQQTEMQMAAISLKWITPTC